MTNRKAADFIKVFSLEKLILCLILHNPNILEDDTTITERNMLIDWKGRLKRITQMGTNATKYGSYGELVSLHEWYYRITTEEMLKQYGINISSNHLCSDIR